MRLGTKGKLAMKATILLNPLKEMLKYIYVMVGRLL